MLTIQNEWIQVGVNTIGAEWASLQSTKSGKEFLWQADPQFWGRHSSILFPIIGSIANDEAHIDGHTYHLKRHGFARNTPFTVQEHQSEMVKFYMQSNDETRQSFPFEFGLEVTYQLSENTIAIKYRVINLQNTPIYFSLGGHPAFNVPIHEGAARSDYQLVFNEAEYAETELLNDDGLRTTTKKVVLQEDQVLPIFDHLFDEDALIFRGLRSNEVSLVGPDGEKVWTFDFTNFPYLGIWSKNRVSPFVCIEPWYGVADPVHPPHDFQDKEGIVKLSPDRDFICEHKVTLHSL